MKRVIEATAIEPEFLTISPLGNGAAIINISYARLIIDGKVVEGALRLNLLRADVRNVVRELTSMP